MPPPDAPPISLAELGRATLARQHLLERSRLSAIEMLEHLVGLQSQLPNPPFTGLWSRIEGFAFDELSARVEDRSAVRLTLMRATVHLVSADDALGLRPLVQETFDELFLPRHRRALGDLDEDAVTREARTLLASGPLSTKRLAEALGDRWPDRPRDDLLMVARMTLPLLQIPPRGVWGRSLQTTYAHLEDFTGRAMTGTTKAELVRRHLAAAGPATVEDVERWSGLQRLAPTFAAAGDDLLRFTGPHGETLYDLPGAPRPPADTPAPVRILPEWDAILMMHADRRRVVDDDRRRAMFSVNGIYAASVLVDGRVAATCKTTKAKAGVAGRIDVWPFEVLPIEVQADISREGSALLEAMGKGYAGGEVVIHAAGTGYPDRRGSAG